MNELLMALLGMGGGGGGGNYNNFGAPSGGPQQGGNQWFGGGPLQGGAPQGGGNQWFGGGPLQGGAPQQMPPGGYGLPQPGMDLGSTQPGQSYDPFQGMFSQPGRPQAGNETHPYGYGRPASDAGGNKGGGYGGPQAGGGTTYGGRPMPMPRDRPFQQSLPYQLMPRPGMGFEPGLNPADYQRQKNQSIGGMVNPGDPNDYRPGGIYSPEGQRRINAASLKRYGPGPFQAL